MAVMLPAMDTDPDPQMPTELLKCTDNGRSHPGGGQDGMTCEYSVNFGRISGGKGKGLKNTCCIFTSPNMFPLPLDNTSTRGNEDFLGGGSGRIPNYFDPPLPPNS